MRTHHSGVRHKLYQLQTTLPMKESLLPELSPKRETIALLKMAARIIANDNTTSVSFS